MSDIHVSVQWKTSAVFAGEELECTITFKNDSQGRTLRRSPSPAALLEYGTSREQWKERLPQCSLQGLPAPGNRTPSMSRYSHRNAKLHRPALSLSASNASSPLSMDSTSESVSRKPSLVNNKHKRSVSIISIPGDIIDEPPSSDKALSSTNTVRGHTRAASLQVLPRSTGNCNSGRSSGGVPERSFTVPSPLNKLPSSFAEQRQGIQVTSRSRSFIGFNTGILPPSPKKPNQNSYRRSQILHELENSERTLKQIPAPSYEKSVYSLRSALSSGLHESITAFERPDPPARILSPSSADGMPRNSADFNSLSDNSTETLASEYITHENSRPIYAPARGHHVPHLPPTQYSSTEILMVGHAQITGSFTLDGSLVNQSAFDDAKKKDIIGGKSGGGVIRKESAKRDSGLLGSLGWGNLGDSIGGLLGGNEISSIKESEGTSNARSIPILSTPQSIIFVDLRLGPGESKSFLYRYPLPDCIPPTHKGRALKISYSLIIGVQCAAKATQHDIKNIRVPFRVLTGVNEQGEILGYDLMRPCIIFSDLSSISAIKYQKPGFISSGRNAVKKSEFSSFAFASYVERLLGNPSQKFRSDLVSRIERPEANSFAKSEVRCTMSDFIKAAILRSNAGATSKHSATRYEIARNGVRVAMIMLARPTYQLGEVVQIAVDFRESRIQCYSLHASLETSETINPAISLRSKASIHRATRRTYASQFDATIAARKIMFNPIIPLASTPDFVTSGISLEWRLRFEFVTSRSGDKRGADKGFEYLLEEVARDERGTMRAAVQGLGCDVFDVTIPLRVYGDIGGFSEEATASDFPI